MDGYEFEYQCAKILKRKHFSKIKVTQSSGDQGIDIIAFKHRKMSEGYILSIKDVEIICSFYEEAIFGLLIRWIIKEEKAKTVDEIKDTVERIEKLFEGQLDLIISNMKK